MECKQLEKNYISCILQKAIQDRSRAAFCHLDKVILYHIECPDYVKKFDNPKTQFHLRRQLFNLLLFPYSHIKMTKAYDNLPKDIRDKENFIPYPEEVKTRPYVEPFNNEIMKRYVENIDFTPDEPRE
jgi:hypothetical protein